MALVAGVWLTVMGLSSHAQQAPAPPDPQKEARLEWFREAKYGLFIHWGLYAIPAGEWKGARVPGIGEWIMNRAKIPVREYEALASQFNPVKFDADAWVQLAQDAGMKYIVITSKHHDGFALFGSKVSRYNVVDATPFKRDILKELAAACAKRKMRLGFYYSQAQDWHEPNGAGNNWDFPPNDKKDFDQYLRDKAEPQVRELLTGYGPVALIWFDTPQLMTAERSQRFTDLVRSLQPNTLIDGRLGAAGDYVSTGDNIIPGEKRTEAWETPATINHTWGYRKDDVDWKRPGEIIFKLVDIVSKGGNYLLNVGPMADGVIPPASQDVLRAAGRWLKVNGEAVYGARPTPFGEELGEPSAKGTKDLRGTAALPVPRRVPRDGEAGKAVLHVLHRNARAVRDSGDEQRGEARVPAGEQRPARTRREGRPHVVHAAEADPRPDGHGRCRRDRGRQGRALGESLSERLAHEPFDLGHRAGDRHALGRLPLHGVIAEERDDRLPVADGQRHFGLRPLVARKHDHDIRRQNVDVVAAARVGARDAAERQVCEDRDLDRGIRVARARHRDAVRQVGGQDANHQARSRLDIGERAADGLHRAHAAAGQQVHAGRREPSPQRHGEVLEGPRARAHHTDDGAAKVASGHASPVQTTTTGFAAPWPRMCLNRLRDRRAVEATWPRPARPGAR